jgi:hypothetical protein
MPGTSKIALVLTALSLFAQLPGCGDDGGSCDTCVGPQAELGSGVVDWEPLAEDQELELIAGPQGGHHFIVHARIRGILPGDPDRPGLDDNPLTQFEVYDEQMVRIDRMFPPYELGYRADGGDWFALPSGRILQVEEDRVAALYGNRALLRLRVEDKVGNVGTDERWVTAVAEADDSDAGVADAAP